MGKFSLKEVDPIRYEQVVNEQKELKAAYASRMTMARMCPYCNHKIEVLCRGNHGGCYIKCPNCSEEVFFPPVSFRRNTLARRSYYQGHDPVAKSKGSCAAGR